MPNRNEARVSSGETFLASIVEAVSGDRLPNAIKLLMSSPLLDGQDEYSQAIKTVTSAMLLPHDAKKLGPVWQLVTDTLTGKDTSQAFPEKFAAFLVADMFLYQTPLPPGRKRYVRDVRTRYGEKDGENITKVVEQIASLVERKEETADAFNAAGEARDVFQKELDGLLNAASVATLKEEALAKITVLDLMVKIKGSWLYKDWQTFTPPLRDNWSHWSRKLNIISLPRGNATYELFEGNALDDVNGGFLEYLWTSWFVAQGGKREEQISYFLSHPALQEIFWQRATSFLLDKYDGDPIISDIFLQEENTVDRFLTTIPLATFHQQDAIACMQNIIACYAFFQNHLPDHPNIRPIGEYIQRIAVEAHLLPRVANELDIATNRKAGILYINPDQKAVARLAKPNETREEFLARREGRSIIYISQAPWPVPKTNSESRPKQAASTLETGGTVFLARWGEVGVVPLSYLIMLLTELNHRLPRQNPRVVEATLAKVRAQYEQTLQLDLQIPPGIIIPEFLGVPFSALKTAGVIGIEQEGENLTFLLDPQTAVIETDARILVFAGQMRGPADIQLLFMQERFSDTPLQALLTGAVLVGRSSFTEQSVTKEELSEIHSWIKAYNTGAKKNNLPQVRFDEDPGKRNSQSAQTVLFVGKKPVLLSIVEN